MENKEPWSSAHLGKVVSVKRWSDTHVSSSGGGGYVNRHGGHVSAPQVHSSVVQREEIFSVDENGKEKTFELGFSGVSFREGSNLLAVWGSEKGEDNGSYLYVENLDTKDKYSSNQGLNIGGNSFFNGFIQGFFFSVAVFVFCVIASQINDSFKNKKLQERMLHNENATLKIADIIKECPPKTITTAVRKDVKYTSCEKGVPAGNLQNMTFWCVCESPNMLAGRLKVVVNQKTYYNGQLLSTFEEVLIFILSISLLSGLFFWAYFNQKITDQYKKIAIKSRNSFVESIQNTLKALNLDVKILNHDPLTLGRKN